MNFRIFRTGLIWLALVSFGLAQGFNTTISGTVSLNGSPVANTTVLLGYGDSLQVQIKETNANGDFSFKTFNMTGIFTVSLFDTFTFLPASASQEVNVENIGQDYRADFAFTDKDLRVQDAVVSANVQAEDGSDVNGKMVYFLKIDDDTDLSDFTQYEYHFAPPGLLARWASYSTEISEGSFSLGMIFGKYVMYVPAGETTLSYWNVFEISAGTELEDVLLREKKTVSGTVYYSEKYDFVTVYAHNLNATRPAMAAVNPVDGSYSVDVAPGDYIFRVTAYFGDHMYMAFYDGAATPKEATVKSVQSDLPGIDFILPDTTLYNFTISGTVSGKSGNSIEGADLYFASMSKFMGATMPLGATTDENGAYSVSGETLLELDSLYGFVSAEGYFAQFYDGQALPNEADPIFVGEKHPEVTVNFILDSVDLSAGYGISGYVSDENGNPVKQGQVQAYSANVVAGVAAALIDSNGFYSFDAIFPGGAVVFLQAWGGFGTLPQIYDNAESWQEATPVVIADANVENINFTLKNTAPARYLLAEITGNIHKTGNNGGKAWSEESAGFDGATVLVKKAGSTQGWSNAQPVSADGSFSISVEADGNYDLLVTAKDYDNTYVSGVTVENLESSVSIGMDATAIADPRDQIVISSTLHEAYPNPFNPSTTIRVEMVTQEQASLDIYNVLGQRVNTLFSGVMKAGLNTFTWNGTDSHGNNVASGLYFYQLKYGQKVQTKTVMFIK